MGPRRDPRPGAAPGAVRGRGSCRVARAHCIDSIDDTHKHTSRDHARGRRGDVGSGVRAGAGTVPLARCRSAGAVTDDPGWGDGAQDIRMMGAWWMPWRWRPRKDAATRRNAPGRRWQPAIRGCPNGATRPAHGRAPRSDPGRAPGELKHLSTPRNREDSLSSGERTGRSPNPAGAYSLPAMPEGGWTSGLEGAAAASQCPHP